MEKYRWEEEMNPTTFWWIFGMSVTSFLLMWAYSPEIVDWLSCHGNYL